MKTILSFIALSCAFMAIFFAGGCGSNNSNSISPVTSLTSCQTGYVYSSSFGCLPQATCPAGYGLYNGNCVVATSSQAMNCSTGNVYSATYGCLVQSSCPAGSGLYNGTCVPASSATTSIACQGSCPAGYVSTSYGCLQQSSCQSCFGHMSPYCVPGAGASSGSYYLGY
jgi:hypothetical protein